ncbi:MAG: PspC domain-containing protein [Opitutales bacterium]
MSASYQPRSTGLRRSRNGILFGVCKGFANYMNLSTTGVRLVFLLILFASFVFGLGLFFPLILGYLIAALAMKPEPAYSYAPSSSCAPPVRQRYDAAPPPLSKKRALHSLKDTLERLDNRTRRLETIVTDRENDWERRFRKSD